MKIVFSGNVRNLWVAVLWALISGTGVAIALLQGAAGPLIGVAISASLLPPVVNCVSILSMYKYAELRVLFFHIRGVIEHSFKVILSVRYST